MLITHKIYNWSIYKITSPLGRVYIGKSSNILKRLSGYRNKSVKSQPLIYRSLCKYGIERHQIDIIETFEGNISYAIDKEMFWIRSYMSNNCKWPEMRGLNLTDGGEGTIGYKASLEHRKKLSEAHKGKAWSESRKLKVKILRQSKPPKPKKEKPIKIKKSKEETRLKMSLAKKGKPAHNKGKPMPPHQVELLRQRMKGKSPLQGKTFSHLPQDVRNKRFGAHNLGNSYNKGRKHSIETIEKYRAAKIGKPHVALYKPILQYSNDGEFIKEYPSIKHTAHETGLSTWTIGCIAKNKMKQPHKFIFKYKQ